MSNPPLPGHWRRDDGTGSAEVAFPTGNTEVFEDERPLASSVPITEPTEAEKAAQLVARVPIPVFPTTTPIPDEIKQALDNLTDDEKEQLLHETAMQLGKTVADAIKLRCSFELQGTPTLGLDQADGVAITSVPVTESRSLTNGTVASFPPDAHPMGPGTQASELGS